MIDLLDLIDDAKCYQTVRGLRWPDGVSCPHCSSPSITKDGKEETQPHCQRYLCHGCRKRFDDLTGTILAGHHQPLRTWVLCLYLMGLNLSSLQIAHELGIHRSDAQEMVQQLRQGVVERRPLVALRDEGEIDEAYVVAGHKGNSEAVEKN